MQKRTPHMRKLEMHAIEALIFSFGIYLGMFFSFAIQQVLDAYRRSLVLTESSVTLGLGFDAFKNIIIECSHLSNRVLIMTILGVASLFGLLVVLGQGIRLAKRCKTSSLVMIITSIMWLLVPVAVISMTIQNPLLYIVIEDENVSKSDLALFSQNFRLLDQYRYFSKAFIYEMKITILALTILALSIYTNYKGVYSEKISKKLFGLILSIPMFAYVLLEVLFPLERWVSYGEKVSMGFGGIGVIGGPVLTEPYLTINQILIGILYILLVIPFFRLVLAEYQSSRRRKSKKKN